MVISHAVRTCIVILKQSHSTSAKSNKECFGVFWEIFTRYNGGIVGTLIIFFFLKKL